MTGRKRRAMLEIIRGAIRRETEAFNYYHKASIRADTPETESLLIQLAAEERKHRAILLDELRKIERLLGRPTEGENHVAEEELQFALPQEPAFRRLQSSRGLDFAAISLPSEMIGGDYLDTIPLERGTDISATGVFLYDIMGHAMGATHLKALAKRAFNELRESWASQRGPVDFNRPDDVVTALNDRLIRECQACQRYVTAFYGVVDPGAQILTYTSAGHEPPILVRCDGEYIHLSQTDLLLCVTRDSAYREVSIPLDPGDTLVVFSDGITEALAPDEDEMFGRHRLTHAVQQARSGPAKEIVRAILATLRDFLDGEPVTDELSLAVMKVRPIPETE